MLRGGGDDVRTVETAALRSAGRHEASGTAQVVVRKDGSRALEVRLDAPAPSDDYYEVWLTEPSLTDMVSLGVARSGHRRPSSCPPISTSARSRVVDVSLEPLDGDPLHSSVSVARGQLES